MTEPDTTGAESPTEEELPVAPRDHHGTPTFGERLAELRARTDEKSRADRQLLEQVAEWFVYHPPREDQPTRYGRLREAAGVFSLSIVENCPGSADRTAALRKVREAVMTANASIALEPPEVDRA